MKPLSVIALLLVAQNLMGQVFPTYSPHFPRVGVAYVVPTQWELTPYASVFGGRIHDGSTHVSVVTGSAGVGIMLPREKEDPRAIGRILLGVNYSLLWNGRGDWRELRKTSVEFGVEVTRGRFSVMALTNPCLVKSSRFYPDSRFGVSYRIVPKKSKHSNNFICN